MEMIKLGMSEGRYGGAFDLEDNTIWTKDELVEFAQGCHMIKLVEEYTKRELQDIFEFCCDMLVERDDIPIPFDRINPTLSNHLRVNNRRVLGQCNRKFCGYDEDGNREYTYDISLNPNFMKYGKEYYQEIIATIAHELTHTINGCFNHGTEFMRYGKMIGDVIGCKVDQKADSGESEWYTARFDGDVDIAGSQFSARSRH